MKWVVINLILSFSGQDNSEEMINTPQQRENDKWESRPKSEEQGRKGTKQSLL